jgi:uncharacterized membrane protein (UPF0127 family)
MGRKDLSQAFLWIPRCSSIHTCFMRGAIDVVFLDGEQRILDVASAVAPWRLRFGPRGTKSVLEVPSGWARANELEKGDVVACR